VQHPLGRGDCRWGATEDSVAQIVDRRHHVAADVGDQPHLARRLGVEGLAGEHGGGDTAGWNATQDRHGDDRRGDADADLGEGERRRVVDDDEVARRHQADAAGADGTVDHGDRRAGGVHQALERPDERR
jgi:hypothetical protein